MRILYMSPSDSAQQGNLLTRAMRKHLGWDAKNYVSMTSYLEYEYDWLEGKNVDEKTIEEFAKGADYFIFQDQYVGEKSSIYKYVNNSNSCIHGLGTPLRATLDRRLARQLRFWDLITPVPCDPTITPHLLCSAPHEALIVNTTDMDKLLQGVEKNDEITAGCAVTEFKLPGVKIIKEQVETMGIKFEHLVNLPWKECIKKKAEWDIVIDPSSIDTSLSMNPLEAIYSNQIAVGNYSSWCFANHPELDRWVFSFNPDMGIYKLKFETAMEMAINAARVMRLDTKGVRKEKKMMKEFILREYGEMKSACAWSYWIQWALAGGAKAGLTRK